MFGAAAPDLCSTGWVWSLATASCWVNKFQLRAKIVTEPDQISDGFGFAPRLLVLLDGLRAAGLIQPGSLAEHVYCSTQDELHLEICTKCELGYSINLKLHVKKKYL